jgi:hypothetical protein
MWIDVHFFFHFDHLWILGDAKVLLYWNHLVLFDPLDFLRSSSATAAQLGSSGP